MTSRYAASCVIRNVHLVTLTTPAPRSLVDIRVTHGRISSIEPVSRLPMASVAHVADLSAPTIDARGAYAIPGLWDHHVHFSQWALTRSRLNLRGCVTVEDCVGAVRGEVERRAKGVHTLNTTLSADPRAWAQQGTSIATTLRLDAPAAAIEPGQRLIVGFGFRSSTWDRTPTAADLDAVSGTHPVVLISNDAHTGWLNSAAMERLGADEPVLVENPWFAIFAAMRQQPDVIAETDAAVEAAMHDAVAKGITGIVDFEWDNNLHTWSRRFANRLDLMRVRTGCYPEDLDEVIAAGLHTGDPIQLPTGEYTTSSMSSATGKWVRQYDALLTMGPLKLITDGSITSRTAWCEEPYADVDPCCAHPRGISNFTSAQVAALMEQATGAQLQVAAHVIGDAAARQVIHAFEHTRAEGTLEHAQMIPPDVVPRLAALGVAASIQPAHLLDDRDALDACMPDRTAWCYPFRSLVNGEVTLRMGSDAPVSPLDPWAAMAAAVHRSGDGREPWHQEQALTPVEALLASTDSRGTLSVGDPGDLVLLTEDPLAVGGSSAMAAEHLRGMTVSCTMVAGRVVYRRESSSGA